MYVLLVGTLDTKATEVAFVADRLRAAGLEVRVLDASADEIFAAAGSSLDEVRRLNDRGNAVTLAASGAAQIASELHAKGELLGVMSLGGSAGTTIGTAAMRALPFGVPKVMVSTLASGQVAHYVGVRDVLMMHSVVDISGLNRISRTVLANAAAAMAGMCLARDEVQAQASVDPKPTVAATMFGVTTPCVEACRAKLEEAGNEVLVFHATGTGGRTMEALIAEGLVTGVLDITTTELADELVGGVLSAGPDRLTAAAMAGVPQVISVGALDMVNFGPMATVPEKFRGRLFHRHNENVTLMRTTPEENDQLGKEIAQKACAAKGRTTILLPLKGVSAIDKEGQPFWSPEADDALFQSIRNWVSADVEVIELDCHINDAEFAEAAVKKLRA